MIVTRFAPSPTGYIHIGNVRSAIYPYLIARQTQGSYILRIEDTDQARFVEGATELIEDTLEWLGLEWNEGPIVGGPTGPYFQSERKAIYYAWAQKLIDMGRAYADPTDAKTIQSYRDKCTEKRFRIFIVTTVQQKHQNGMKVFRSGLNQILSLANGATKLWEIWKLDQKYKTILSSSKLMVYQLTTLLISSTMPKCMSRMSAVGLNIF